VAWVRNKIVVAGLLLEKNIDLMVNGSGILGKALREDDGYL